MQETISIKIGGQETIPAADSKPVSVVEQKYVAPAVVTSAMARKQAMKDLAELSRLTGKQYTL